MATLLVFASPAAANPVEPGSLILTSTSGQYWEIGCPNSITGTAAGTITLTPFVSASSAINYRITAGAVSLGATTYAITGGEALVTQEFITGHGTVQGGSFNFSAFSVSPTARPPRTRTTQS